MDLPPEAWVMIVLLGTFDLLMGAALLIGWYRR
jgi:hypothetical protein